VPDTFAAVVATRNRRALVEEAVASLVQQRRQPDEILVVDDGSTDGTAELLMARYPEITVVRQAWLGQSIARNTGISRARSEWVCFLDHDDLWQRDKLAEVERYLSANPDCEALNHPMWFFATSEDGPVGRFGLHRDFVAADLAVCHTAAELAGEGHDSSYLRIRGHSYERLLVRNAGALSATAVRRETAIRAGAFPPGRAEDWRFFRNVARLAEWHTLERWLGFVRLHLEQTTMTEVQSAHLLAAYVEAWWGGRPDPARPLSSDEVRERLSGFGRPYREMVQEFLWGAIRARRWNLAVLDYHLGAAILPRRRDRAWALLPLPLTYRLGALRRGASRARPR